MRLAAAEVIGGLAAPSNDLEADLRAATGDPNLRLYRWSGDPDRADGRWLRDQQPPPAAAGFADTEIQLGERPVALLVHHPELAYQRQLLDAVTALTFASENRRQLAHRERYAAEQGQLAERKRLGEAIHHQIQTPLGIIGDRVREVSDQLGGDPELDKALDGLAKVQTWVRRIERNYNPEDLFDGGVKKSVRAWVRGAAVPGGQVRINGPNRRWPISIELAAHLIACEAIQNALRHSGATRITVSVAGTDDNLELRVDDNGSGFTLHPQQPHFGLQEMQRRARSVGGRLSIGAGPAGCGTSVLAVLPAAAS